jgi:hypothetical protein
MLQCNFLQEGCKGGQPILDAFFYEQGYMVAESCAPYHANTKGLRCHQYENCKPLAKIEKTQFVGGGYAHVSEKQMMKDILRNGPISGDMMAGEQFKVYESGVLSEKQSKSLA